MAQAIKVAVRVRPLLPAEQAAAPELCISTYDTQGLLTVKKEVDEARSAFLSPARQRAAATAALNGKDDGTETLAFDHVWGLSSTQDNVFDQVKPLIDGAFEGYNSTVFAYGPSGSGKTHTMLGSAGAPGIVPRAIQRVLELAKAQPENMFVFVLSVLELYNDAFYDLLDDTTPTGGSSKKRRGASGQSVGPGGVGVAKKIEVVRNGKGSQLRGDYTKLQIDDAASAMVAIEASLGRRSTSGTQLNDRSSRSHAVVILQAQQASVDRRASCGTICTPTLDAGALGTTTIGTLYMVDLAGSERIKLSAVVGTELEEAKHINKSLSALGNVLTSLSSKKKGEVVPYRDSKLTLLLQDALGGNSKTMMITCINPKKDSYAYSSVALQYAVRAKHVTNTATINVDSDKSSEIEALKLEIETLRRRLNDRQIEFNAVSTEQVENAEQQASQYDRMKEILVMNQRENQELKVVLLLISSLPLTRVFHSL